MGRGSDGVFWEGREGRDASCGGGGGGRDANWGGGGGGCKDAPGGGGGAGIFCCWEGLESWDVLESGINDWLEDEWCGFNGFELISIGLYCRRGGSPPPQNWGGGGGGGGGRNAKWELRDGAIW